MTIDIQSCAKLYELVSEAWGTSVPGSRVNFVDAGPRSSVAVEDQHGLRYAIREVELGEGLVMALINAPKVGDSMYRIVTDLQAEMERSRGLQAELDRAREKEASALAYSEGHKAARMRAERELDAVLCQLAKVMAKADYPADSTTVKHRRFLCSYQWDGGARRGVGMTNISFEGPMTWEAMIGVAKHVEDDLLRKHGIESATVVVMGMLELEGDDQAIRSAS